ncbi:MULTISPECIES: hypothetical protein [unclassified Variovorax]|uniref:hypothetical protein n=1 Tax=unclassified Variovorax TaxID=663243 RepID=UPI00076D90D2|nr:MULTISPECIES: hypothetical protein [unclassified Variovorax]KWT64455.1 hypothetical protein APY03_7633 [Variovorax sp. WDL1]PNG56327.1 hypothetical protein CHC07_02742 [Variovorax sp. B4]PNG57751.1 hypothetical protein CHC06_02745 [Variovorax sp. B2]VTV09817.1 hypothetical protein WDL1CHR_00884 [Variovorax sp. WDL1]
MLESRPLPGILRSRVNRIAHAAALKHEADMRARLILELQQQMAAGVPLAGLHQLLDQVEGGGYVFSASGSLTGREVAHR